MAKRMHSHPAVAPAEHCPASASCGAAGHRHVSRQGSSCSTDSKHTLSCVQPAGWAFVS